jgi:hypothetical protein
MESIKPKIVAAISGALNAYTEEKRLIRIKEEKVSSVLMVPFNLWGIAGRQEIMLKRYLWQLRLNKGRV